MLLAKLGGLYGFRFICEQTLINVQNCVKEQGFANGELRVPISLIPYPHLPIQPTLPVPNRFVFFSLDFSYTTSRKDSGYLRLNLTLYHTNFDSKLSIRSN